MWTKPTRRGFLRTAAAATTIGAGPLAFLRGLSSVSAGEARLNPSRVALRPEIEPLVRLLEETPRDEVLERVAKRIRGGATYPDVVAALLLAGVRNIEPRPVGFKFHAVLVVNSAHLASLASPPGDRWLPIFWAIDEFKDSQADDAADNGEDWTLAAVDEAALPPSHRAGAALAEALDNWDESAADVAAAAVGRTASAAEAFEIFARYGARDFRSIGHKAIYVANAHRALATIGWRHAEPVVRSLAYALLAHEGDNPANRDGDPDRPWRRNQPRAKEFRDDWRAGKRDPAASAELIAVCREGSADDASTAVVRLINAGISPDCLWDALLFASGELVMRRPGIPSLHAVTTTNALRFAFEQSGIDETRRMLLLQNAAFLPLFRGVVADRGREPLPATRLDQFESAAVEPGAEGLEAIFDSVPSDRAAAAARALAWLEAGGDAAELVTAARRFVFAKGDDSHDYKFSSAVFEDYLAASPELRNRYLASSLFLLPGAQMPDNALLGRIRSALG